ncbi:MAG TPA: ferritin-like domain-containing protein [Hypericibacter adhaerens]|uniref:ferritin-like domain-containing protein n=1 Tax=Hypericibacter adhaerens TaxID=2602016 RepID=UPI002CE2FCCA|nr:ferritin-like domain-containing protein [Hypericibacter adhaerens]HWA44854.1 ferritin-like domain-containing protein [Hypericibacter adhaerens]
MSPSLAALAVATLATPDPAAKAAAARAMAATWRQGALPLGRTIPPERPARPERPELRRPGDMPKRRATGSLAHRVALLHALAHIELNAIDLACDILARFPDAVMPRAFHDDWVSVADEEAKHYGLLADRLAALGSAYGDLPAHDGLWQAAEETAGDLLARLAIVPLVLEARGLDVTPKMIADLKRAGDEASAAVLTVIYEEEIGHVAIGRRWFLFECERRGLDPAQAWRELVRRHFKGSLKPPFNDAARIAAGLVPAEYAGLAERP